MPDFTTHAITHAHAAKGEHAHSLKEAVIALPGYAASLRVFATDTFDSADIRSSVIIAEQVVSHYLATANPLMNGSLSAYDDKTVAATNMAMPALAERLASAGYEVVVTEERIGPESQARTPAAIIRVIAPLEERTASGMSNDAFLSKLLAESRHLCAVAAKPPSSQKDKAPAAPAGMKGELTIPQYRLQRTHQDQSAQAPVGTGVSVSSKSG